MALLAGVLGWMFDGFEMGLFPVIARPALRSMLPGQGEAAIGNWMGIITALFLLGAACGGALFGWLGDRIGRVRALAMSILCYSLCTGLGYFAVVPWHLGAFRFIAALGMGGEWALGVALVMEVWPEKWRPWLAGAIGVSANIGYLLVGVLAALVHVTTDSWRWMMLVGASPCLLVFFIRLFVPESKKWKDAVTGGRARPMHEVFSRGLRGKTLIGIGLASVALIGTWGSVLWIPVWVDQITGGALPGAKAIAQTLVSAGAIVGTLLAPLIVPSLGRRRTYFALCLASLGVTALLFRFTQPTWGPALYLPLFLTGLTTSSFYGWFPLYLPELFPTRVRATGQGICYNSGRVLAAVGTVLQSHLVAAFHGDYGRAAATLSLPGEGEGAGRS
jgi:MFS family permease